MQNSSWSKMMSLKSGPKKSTLQCGSEPLIRDMKETGNGSMVHQWTRPRNRNIGEPENQIVDWDWWMRTVSPPASNFFGFIMDNGLMKFVNPSLHLPANFQQYKKRRRTSVESMLFWANKSTNSLLVI